MVLRFSTAYVDLYYASDADVLADIELNEFWAQWRSTPGSQIPELTGKRTLSGALGLLVVVVTGLHNHVGNVADVIVDPFMCSGKIRPGTEVADVQAAFQMMNVGLATAAKGPMLLDSNVEHLLLDDGAKKVWADFNQSLWDLQVLRLYHSSTRTTHSITCNLRTARQQSGLDAWP